MVRGRDICGKAARSPWWAIGLLCVSLFRLSGQETVLVDSLETALDGYSRRDTGLVDRLNELGYEYWIVNPSASIRYGNLALQLSDSLDYSAGKAYALRVIGVGYWAQGNGELAFHHLTRSRQAFSGLGDVFNAANAQLNLGMVYADQRDPPAAKRHYREALRTFQRLGDSSRIATALTKIADVYIREEKFDSAFHHLRKALEIHERNEFIYGIGEVNAKLGNISLANQDYDNAISHYLLAVKAGGQRYDHIGIAENFAGIGTAYLAKGQLDQADDYLGRAERMAQAFGLRKVQYAVYAAQRDRYATLGDYPTALRYAGMREAMADTLFSQELSRMLANQEASSRFRRQEEQLELARANLALLEQRHYIDRLTRWLLLLGLALTTVTGYLLLQRKNRRLYRKKLDLAQATERTDELNEELKDRERALTAYSLNLAHRSEAISNLRTQIDQLRKESPAELRGKLGKLSRKVGQLTDRSQEWEDFRRHFNAARPELIAQLKADYPELTQNEIRLIALLVLNLTTKEIGSILGISPDSVKTARYRLRKKLAVPPSVNLYDFLLTVG